MRLQHQRGRSGAGRRRRQQQAAERQQLCGGLQVLSWLTEKFAAMLACRHPTSAYHAMLHGLDGRLHWYWVPVCQPQGLASAVRTLGAQRGFGARTRSGAPASTRSRAHGCSTMAARCCGCRCCRWRRRILAISTPRRPQTACAASPQATQKVRGIITLGLETDLNCGILRLIVHASCGVSAASAAVRTNKHAR